MKNKTSNLYKFKKYSNEKLVMLALITLLDNINELKTGVYRLRTNTKALKDELRTRIKEK